MAAPDGTRSETALATEFPEPCDLHDYASELTPQLRQVMYLLEERMLAGHSDSANINYFSSQVGVPVLTIRRMTQLIRRVWAIDTQTFAGAMQVRDDIRAKMYAIHRTAIEQGDLKVAVVALDKIAEIDNLKNPTMVLQQGSANMITNVARENVMALMDKMAALSTRKQTITGPSREVAVIAHADPSMTAANDKRQDRAKVIDIGIGEVTVEPLESQVIRAPARPPMAKMTPGQAIASMRSQVESAPASVPASVTAPTLDPTKLKRDPTKLPKKAAG